MQIRGRDHQRGKGRLLEMMLRAGHGHISGKGRVRGTLGELRLVSGLYSEEVGRGGGQTREMGAEALKGVGVLDVVVVVVVVVVGD